MAGYLHTALENPDYEGEVFAAAHHVMYYTDWLTTKRSVVNGEYIKTDLYDYASLYNDRGTYAPAMMFGRNAWFDAMSTAGNKCCTYMPGSAMEIESLIQQIRAIPPISSSPTSPHATATTTPPSWSAWRVCATAAPRMVRASRSC